MRMEYTAHVHCPCGFYCLRAGMEVCTNLDVNQSYDGWVCAEFNSSLEKDKRGNVLKCEKCLLTERETRLKVEMEDISCYYQRGV